MTFSNMVYEIFKFNIKIVSFTNVKMSFGTRRLKQTLNIQEEHYHVKYSCCKLLRLSDAKVVYMYFRINVTSTQFIVSSRNSYMVKPWFN